MKKLLLAVILPFLWSCGNGSSTMNNQDPMDGGTSQGPGGTGGTDVPILQDAPAPPEPNLSYALSNSVAGAASSGFCDVQKQLQILSASLISAYSSRGNSNKPDPYYCGVGTAVHIPDGDTFSIELTDYCANVRGQQVTLNGSITGRVDSGSNFFSDISQLTIEGDGINLSLDGTTRYGRIDDMFMTLNISDLVNNIEVGLEEVNLKDNAQTHYGEFDLGYLILPNVGKFYFKFITHFNAELTEGMLFIYGEADQVVIISADSGTITVVYKENKQDPGTLITQTSCGS